MLTFEAVKDDFTSAGIEFNEYEVDGDKVIIAYMYLQKNTMEVEVVVKFSEKISICKVYMVKLAKVESGSKQYYRTLEVCNEFNIAFHYYKMYINRDNTVWIQATLDMKKFDMSEFRMTIESILYALETDIAFINDTINFIWS